MQQHRTMATHKGVAGAVAYILTHKDEFEIPFDSKQVAAIALTERVGHKLSPSSIKDLESATGVKLFKRKIPAPPSNSLSRLKQVDIKINLLYQALARLYTRFQEPHTAAMIELSELLNSKEKERNE